MLVSWRHSKRIIQMTQPELLNPNQRLLPQVLQQLRPARKTKPLWAKRLQSATEVKTMEGQVRAEAGDYLCRGISGELWPQREQQLLEKYIASAEFDADGWQRFDPKPDSTVVNACQWPVHFTVVAHWGTLSGKIGDYVVQSSLDPADVWIVDQTIFQASYHFVEVP